MLAEHLEFLVEEPSMEAFLEEVLPKILGVNVTFALHVYQGKTDLMGKLEQRLRGYSRWLPENARVVVLLDKDDDDCKRIKLLIEEYAEKAELATRKSGANPNWSVLGRVVIEELEAWYFGNWASVRKAYPRVSKTAHKKAHLRNCDEIAGGTWEAFERVLQSGGYFSGGLRKVEVAKTIGENFDILECISPSFLKLKEGLLEAINN